jgi:hypothetical protein
MRQSAICTVRGMTNIMLSTDELMTIYVALERATEAALQAAKARGDDPNTSREYTRFKQLMDKVKQATQ